MYKNGKMKVAVPNGELNVIADKMAIYKPFPSCCAMPFNVVFWQ